ncbi:sodium:proton antiporter [Nocardia terpenica]|uniref:Dehydrogenase n=1 Tax=Nocardia terpenica TaxID=455432 RepID=A0A6G9Z707_9NOCA|nr:cation:proton antiporter subunit C [Nocardia terpenica]QIS21137.1 dehydrogenase [Nocardia terpenica]
MTVFPYLVAGWLLLAGLFGVARSKHLVHTVVCVSVAQSSTYVLLLAIGYQSGATAPIFGSSNPPGSPVVDPVVQAMTLTDIVVSATVTALLLALVVQVAARHGTVVPDELHALRG